MKSKLFIILLPALMFGGAMQACDACGCSASGQYMGILPQFHRHFMSMRWNYNSFVTHQPSEIAPNIMEEASREYFHQFEVWGRFAISKRLQLFAFVPFKMAKQTTSTHDAMATGIGDIALMANFIVFNTGDSTSRNWKHALSVGGGLRIPTGSTKQREEGRLLHQNLQPGGGSFRFLANATYTIRHKNVGVNAETNVIYSLVNPQHFQSGLQINTTLRAFLWQSVSREWSILPSAGGMFEHSAHDHHYGEEELETGGNMLALTAGMDVYFRRLMFGFHWQQPIWHNMSNGLVTPGGRASLSVAFML